MSTAPLHRVEGGAIIVAKGRGLMSHEPEDAARTVRTEPRPLLAYVWAAPMSLLGLLLGAITMLTGGAMERRAGVVEFRDGLAPRILRLPFLRASAITVGHVILGRDSRSIDGCRGHEHGHVRQVELWGLFFLPAYLVAGAWAHLRGGHYYRDNWFERDADRYGETRREKHRE
jgi:hypothetical protein